MREACPSPGKLVGQARQPSSSPLWKRKPRLESLKTCPWAEWQSRDVSSGCQVPAGGPCWDMVPPLSGTSFRATNTKELQPPAPSLHSQEPCTPAHLLDSDLPPPSPAKMPWQHGPRGSPATDRVGGAVPPRPCPVCVRPPGSLVKMQLLPQQVWGGAWHSAYLPG